MNHWFNESLIEQTDSSEDPFFSAENFSAENLNPVELALSETSAEESASDEPEVKGPELKFPGTVKKHIEPLEVNHPKAPLLLDPGQEIQQTPGPLMPPLNAEPLEDSRKKKCSQKRPDDAFDYSRTPSSCFERRNWKSGLKKLQGVPHKAASDLLSIRKLFTASKMLKTQLRHRMNCRFPRLDVNAVPQLGSILQGPPSDQTGFIGFSSKADLDELLHRLKPTRGCLEAIARCDRQQHSECGNDWF